jgi:hypothetical protein
MSATVHLEKAIANTLLRGVSWAYPASGTTVVLMHQLPDEDGTGGVEVSGSVNPGYSGGKPVVSHFNAGSISGSSGAFLNHSPLNFGVNTGSDSWLEVVGWALKNGSDYLLYGNFYDANGNIITYEVEPGNSFMVPIGALVIEID